MNPPIRLALACLCLWAAPAYAQFLEMSLSEAVERHLVVLKAPSEGGSYGKALRLIVRNVNDKAMHLSVAPGQTFHCQQEGEQDLVLAERLLLDLPPKGKVSQAVYVFGIEANDVAPRRGVDFDLGPMAEGPLLELAEYIAENGWQSYGMSQCAVWAVTDGRAISDVFGKDFDAAKKLTAFVAEKTGRPAPERMTHKDHHIVSMKSRFSFELPRPVRASLTVYDSTGREMFHIFDDEPLRAGFQELQFGLNYVAEEGSYCEVKLVASDGTVIDQRRVREGEEQTEEFEQERVHFDFDFDLEKSYGELDLAIFDEGGHLVQTMHEARPFPKGHHALQHDFFHRMGPDARFFVRLLDGKDVVADMVIASRRERNAKHPPMRMETALEYYSARPIASARLLVYDQYGELVETVFSDKRIENKRGTIPIRFTHTKGKGAKFVIRLLSSRQIVAEKRVRQE